MSKDVASVGRKPGKSNWTMGISGSALLCVEAVAADQVDSTRNQSPLQKDGLVRSEALQMLACELKDELD